MSVEIRLLNQGRGLLYTYGPAFSYEEDQSALAELAAQLDMTTVRFTVLDHSSTEEVSLTNEQVRAIADGCVETSRRIPDQIVAVVSPSDLSYGLGRMWGMLSDETGWSIQIFRDLDAAETWVCSEYETLFGEQISAIERGRVVVGPELS